MEQNCERTRERIDPVFSLVLSRFFSTSAPHFFPHYLGAWNRLQSLRPTFRNDCELRQRVNDFSVPFVASAAPLSNALNLHGEWCLFKRKF